jgi:hypothetical protein
MNPEPLRKRWSGWRGTTMLDIATVFAARGARLLIVGDSLSGQLYRAAGCASPHPFIEAILTSSTPPIKQEIRNK